MVTLNTVLLQVQNDSLVWITLCLILLTFLALKPQISKSKFFAENVPLPPPPEDYTIDETDQNRFINKFDKEICIRVHHNIKGDKDKVIFAFSVPVFVQPAYGNFGNENFHIPIPQLVKTEITGTHEILLTKSTASNWADIKEPILKFLFAHLNEMYEWKREKQVIAISIVPNPEILTFHLRIETKYHLGLGRKLYSVKGIVHGIGDGHPSCMNHDGHYNFHLEKARSYTWDELLPKIKKVFGDYFIAGVEFKNIPSEYSERDFAMAGRGFDDDDRFYEPSF